ncbi:MAG: serine/threonine-protein phosphatase, partial [Spirochaetia bacterium]|nr:serine/threonine-protein phosphatase [Spirochaetia bacterium]
NAGHPPPILVRPTTGQLVLLEKGGPPVGMIDGVEYEARMIKTKPGDRLVLYSDGLTETNNASGEQFGMERVEKIVADNGAKGAAEIAELLGQTLAGFAHEYTDDVSVVAVELP